MYSRIEHDEVRRSTHDSRGAMVAVGACVRKNKQENNTDVASKPIRSILKFKSKQRLIQYTSGYLKKQGKGGDSAFGKLELL